MSKRAILVAVSAIAMLVLATCENPMRTTLEAVVQQYSTAQHEVNFRDRAGIAETSVITIRFTESIDPASLEMEGEIADESAGAVWSQTEFPNDTLTISPRTTWTHGGHRSLTVRALDLQEYPAAPIDLSYGVLDGVIYVHPDGDDSNYGTVDLPKASIQAAIDDVEAAYEQAEVRVAAGTYESAEPISVTKELTLTGGFSPDDWQIRESDANWAVSGDGTSAYPTEIRVPVTNAGWTIDVSGAPGEPVIEGFTIFGPAGTDSAALQLYDTNALVSSCRIEGAQADSSIGIVLYVSSSTITKCYVSGGTSDLSTGIFAYQSDAPTISESVITGGSGEQTSAVKLIDSSPLVERNDIFGGTGRTDAAALYVEDGSDAVIRNNLIDAGTGRSTFGLWVKDSNPLIQNNTIDGGGASGSIAAAIHEYATASARIENNIITVSTGTNQYGVSVGDAASAPATIENNCFYFHNPNDSTFVYLDIDAQEEYETVDVLNSGLAVASDNVGDDPEVNWSGDWNLTADSPASVIGEGLNLSDEYTTDYNGDPRPGSGGWSMGAYQYP